MTEQLPIIHLRALEPEDLDSLYNIENDEDLWDVGVTNVPYSRFVLSAYIANSTADIYADRQVRLVIEDEHHCTVGLLDIFNFDPRHSRAEVGIVVARRFRHRGYATAALLHAVDYSRKVCHLHQLYAIVDGDNAQSLQLFQKVGFTQTASLKNWLRVGDSYRDALMMQFFL